MPGLSKQQALDDLRARIETIEKHPRLARPDEAAPESEPAPRPPPGLRPRGLCRCPAQHRRGARLRPRRGAHHAGPAPAGHPAHAARTRQPGRRRPLCRRSHRVRHRPGNRRPLPARTTVELLWAVEEAIACKAVAAVIADVGHEAKVLDFTATRRLSLRSSSGGSSVFLIRYGRGTRGDGCPLPMAHRTGCERPGCLRPAGPWPPRDGRSISRKDDWGHARTRGTGRWM